MNVRLSPVLYLCLWYDVFSHSLEDCSMYRTGRWSADRSIKRQTVALWKDVFIENISVTHLGQKSLEYMSFETRHYGDRTCCTSRVSSGIAQASPLEYVVQVTPGVITTAVRWQTVALVVSDQTEVKDKQTTSASRMKNGCRGFELRFCFLFFFWMVWFIPEWISELAATATRFLSATHYWAPPEKKSSVLTHSQTHSSCLKVPGNTFNVTPPLSEFTVMSVSVLYITFCSSNITSSKPCSFYYHTDTVLCSFTFEQL